MPKQINQIKHNFRPKKHFFCWTLNQRALNNASLWNHRKSGILIFEKLKQKLLKFSFINAKRVFSKKYTQKSLKIYFIFDRNNFVIFYLKKCLRKMNLFFQIF